VTDETLVDALNRSCHCIAVDQGALQKSLATRLDESGILSRLQQTHPNLLADSPVFVSLDQIRQMKAVIAAIERIAGIERFREKVLQWAPDIAAANPGPQGVFFGYDFLQEVRFCFCLLRAPRKPVAGRSRISSRDDSMWLISSAHSSICFVTNCRHRCPADYCNAQA
jgi:hypothetical protein